MSTERILDDYPVNEIINGGETDQADYAAPDSLHSYDDEGDGLPTPGYDDPGIANSTEASAAPTLRERLRRGLGRAAAVLALTGAALGGNSIAPDEAEAAPVACHNNDGTTGLRVGELCLVNAQRYSNAKGPSNTDRAVAFVAAGALGGKCETAFFAGENTAGFATAYALRVYKAGKYVKNSNLAGLGVSAAGQMISSRVCK